MTTITFPHNIDALLARIAPQIGADAWVVGGSVRDALLDRPMRDLDLAVHGDALSLAHDLARAFDAHFVELDDRHAIARVVLRHPDDGAVAHIDVARLQGSLEEDLRRRDFTIDAMAVSLDGGTVNDVTSGLADVRARLVRMTAAAVFDEDPLRLLRGPRLAAELGFGLAPDTAAEIRNRAGGVNAAAAERRRDELARIFAVADAHAALRLLADLSLLDVLLPELAAGKGVTQPGAFHAYDVFEHNMRAVEAMDIMLAAGPPSERAWIWAILWEAFEWCAAELREHFAKELSEGRSRASILKFASLLHDVAKPQTREEQPDGRVRFLGHADLGARTAARIMRRLRFSAAEVRFVSTLVAEHLRPVQLAAIGEVPTRRALYRFYRDLGDAVPAVLFLSLSDAAAARGPSLTPDGWKQHVAYMNSLLLRAREEEGIADPPRLLGGHDIMTILGVPEGQAVGRMLEALREAQAAGEVSDRESAVAFIRQAANAEAPARPA